MNDKIYWFITVFTNCEEDDLGWLKIGSSRTWGFYSNKKDALKTLHENRTDMWETIYDYAVLEPYYEGISGYCFKESRQFFEYDVEKDGYFEIEEPEEVKHYASFAIG